MSWRDIMQRVLPPIGGISPNITSAGAYGAVKGRTPPSSMPHGGVDFNYPVGQTGINLKHPEIRSPVAGTVTTNPGEGRVGRIAIKDANGLSHEILHTSMQYVKRGDLVGVGQPIGTMGNTGAEDHHVHYQLKDPAGRVINPTDFWGRLGPAKSDPGQPAYLDEYQRYSQLPNQAVSPDRSNSFDNRFGKWPAAPFVSPPDAAMFAAPSPPAIADNKVRILGTRVIGKSDASPSDRWSPVVPFAPPDEVLSPGPPASFADRFGDWMSFPAGSALSTPSQPLPPPEDRSSTRGDAGNIRVLTSRIVPFNGVGNSSPTSAGFSSQPAPIPQDDRPLGLFTGQPMSNNPLSPSIWDFIAKSRTPRDGEEDWLSRWIGGWK